MNTPEKEFTGLTSAIGNTNTWSLYGGSRNILMTTDEKDVDNSDNWKYQYFDCTKNVNISFNVDASKLMCGMVLALYMVAMEPASIANGVDMSGSLYNDAQGIGFIDNSGAPLNKQRGRTEIDLLETTGRGAQTTLHGVADDNTEKTKKTISDRHDKWNQGGGDDRIDMDGIWENANVNKNSGEFKSSLMFGNSNLDDLSNNAIDSSKPFKVDCKITPTEIKGTDYCYINLETTLSQNGNTITLKVDSSAPNKNIDTQIATKFPKSELKKMVFIYSLWGDEKGTGWLDGINDPDKRITDKFNKRGNCDMETGYSEIQTIMKNVELQSKNNKTAKECAQNDKTYFANVYDITFNIEDGKSVKDDNYNKFAWTLDLQYRGVITEGDMPEPWNKNNNGVKLPEPNIPQNWKGRYNFSYLNCQNNPNGFSLPDVNTYKNSMLENMNVGGGAPDTGLKSGICTNNKLFENNTMNRVSSDDITDEDCPWNENRKCQIIRTNLIPYGSPSPSPPGPGPGPSPGPSSSSSQNKNAITYLSLIFSIILLLICCFVFIF